MENHVVIVFVLVSLVALSGFFGQGFAVEDTPAGAVVKQRSALVNVVASGQKVVQVGAKKAMTGLIIKNGMSYAQTPMMGMVHVAGIPISVNTLQEHGVTLQNGVLLTPNKKTVQIKDSALRRKPIKLTF